MNPLVPDVLNELAGLMLRSAAPDRPDAERASDLGLSAQLLSVAAEIWDRQAHILVEENRAIRALLGESGLDDDLHLSALKAANDGLRVRLIEAQIAAETAGDLGRQAAIWAELAVSTERRRLSTAPV